MDWDMPMTPTYTMEPLTVASYRKTLQSPAAVGRAILIGSIAKPEMSDIIKLYPEHFGKLIAFADRRGIPHNELIAWITDYICWSESEDFIDR
jgi:hypothetical protein